MHGERSVDLTSAGGSLGSSDPLAQKTVRLSIIGFTAGDIATILQTVPATVYQYLYEAKKRAGVKKPRAKATAKAE